MKVAMVRVPGKLMLMGEYAVTQAGHPGIVLAIDRYLLCRIEPSIHYVLEFPGVAAPIHANDLETLYYHLADIPPLNLVTRCIVLVQNYLQEEGRNLAPFHLSVQSELQSTSGIKYGLGSSAAVSVAVVAGLFRYAIDVNVDKEILFKIASVAHALVQTHGSGADVAAATYGGMILYERFDPRWLHHRMTVKTSLHSLMHVDWPMLNIRRLPRKPDVVLYVGWTRHPVSTSLFLQHMVNFQERSPHLFQQFLVNSDLAVKAFVQAKNPFALFRAVDGNRAALATLAEQTAILIETMAIRRALTTVKRLGGVGKTSGSGGGDVLVAWFRDQSAAKTLRAHWSADGIEFMAVSPDVYGVTYD